MNFYQIYADCTAKTRFPYTRDSLSLRRCVVGFLLCTGGRSFDSETFSQRLSATRQCVGKIDRSTSPAAILNNAVRFAADSGSEVGRCASLDHHGRRARPRRRLNVWTVGDRQDDGSEDDFEAAEADVDYQDTALSASLASVRAVTPRVLEYCTLVWHYYLHTN